MNDSSIWGYTGIAHFQASLFQDSVLGWFEPGPEGEVPPGRSCRPTTFPQGDSDWLAQHNIPRDTVSLTSPMGKLLILFIEGRNNCWPSLQYVAIHPCVIRCKRKGTKQWTHLKSPWGLRQILRWNLKTGPVWPNQMDGFKNMGNQGQCAKRRGCCRHLQRCAEHDLPPAARLYPAGRQPNTQYRWI